GSDCASGVCSGAVCQAPTCADVVKNGAETDSDCGGPVCSACGDGKKCSAAGDCTSKICAGMPLACVAPSCNDLVTNGGESDTDCGAVCPTKCAVGQVCAGNGDCAGNLCNMAGKVCDPTCTDGLKNSTETDVDCGGPCATKCAIGKSCALDGDCATGLCTGGMCGQINGCDPVSAEDHTGSAADVPISFPGVALSFTPKCIKVKLGTKVVFNGNFAGHPLQAGEFKGGNEIPAAPGTTPLPTAASGLNSGMSASFVMTPVGTYPYYCIPHGPFGMTGAIFVVP
ncbi:MAG: plastocyanin/azurin family copper-binding protein, partial [Byssovorax sp.]